uniref:THIF-type NAD/FAD binding fold domain-containing protein n=1 Tax=Nannospalax galili TaxID=1026970 RepID=A0A8C6R2W5_NANGA
MVEKEEAQGCISKEEAAQYDLQIHLWGLEAQKWLRASQVLLVGMKGLKAEIAKTLILGGVKGQTMLDHEQLSPEDPRFLIHTGSVGRNRAEASLERVDTEDIEKKPESFFTQFDAKVIFFPVKEALEVDWSMLLKFRTNKGRDRSSETLGEDSELLLQICEMISLISLSVLPNDFVRHCFSEMAPVWILAQETVKTLSQRDPPHSFFFSRMKGSGMIVECLGHK